MNGGPETARSGGAVSWYCRTCRHALHRYTTPNGPQALIHASDWRGDPAGHAPDPVPLDQLRNAVMKCDFCDGPDPAWIYRCADQHTQHRVVTSRTVSSTDYRDRHHAARTLSTRTTAGITDRWGELWAVCEDCAALIEQRDLYGLISRITDTLPTKYTRGKRLRETRGHLHAAYSTVLDTLAPGRGRITPDHPLGIWEPAEADPAGHNRPSTQDGSES